MHLGTLIMSCTGLTMFTFQPPGVKAKGEQPIVLKAEWAPGNAHILALYCPMNITLYIPFNEFI